MNSNDKENLIKDCTSTMSIDIDNIPKDLCIEVAELINKAIDSEETTLFALDRDLM